MQNLKPLTTALLAISLLGSSTLMASAQEATPTDIAAGATIAEPAENTGIWNMIKAKMGGRKDGKSGGHRGEMLQTLFAEVDADKNGSLTQDEINTYRTAKVAAADTSKDGVLTLDEFKVVYAAMMNNRTVDAFQRLDADGNGSITAAEIDVRVATMVERMDRDGDGVISKNDRPEKGSKRHGNRHGDHENKRGSGQNNQSDQ